MGVPLDLGNIYSGFASASAYNANNTLIEEAVAKALDRTGSTDNAMEVDLDMGLNNIFNVKSAVLSHQAVPLQQLMDILTSSGSEVTSLVAMEDRVTAVGGETVIPFSVITYTPTTNSLMVFKNGDYQRAGEEYQESGNTEITFTTPLVQGDVVDVFGSRYDAQQYVDLAIKAAEAAQISSDAAEQSAQQASDAADLATSAAGYKLDVNNQVGVTYTLQLTDEGDFIRMDNPAANTLIVPPDSSVNFELGTIILVRQVGEGVTTVQKGLGVTINAPYNSYEISQADFGVALVKIAPDTWDMVKSFGGVDTSDLAAFTQEFDARLQELYTDILSADPTFVVNFDALTNKTDNAVAAIQSEFDLLETNVQNSVGSLNANFSNLQIQFGFIEAQFISIQNDFNVIQPQFDTMQQDFATLLSRFNDIETQWIGIDARMSQIESDLAGLNIGQGDFEASLFDYGYQKMPSGLIFQWGTTDGIPNKQSRTIEFPLPYPNNVLNISLTTQGYNSYIQESMFVLNSSSKTGFNTTLNYVGDGKGGNPTLRCYWIAIGH